MIPGTDISYWQTNDARSPQHFFSAKQAKEKGMEFVYIRACYGTREDSAADTFARECEEVGIPFGFYQFAVEFESVAPQMEKFLSIIDRYNWSMPPALDLEREGVGLSFAKYWLENVENITNRTPVIYTSPNFWNNLRGSENATWATKYPLWIANYYKKGILPYPVYHIPDRVKNSVTLPNIPAPFTDYVIWQYSDLGDGEFYGGDYAKHTNETSLDLNVFNGSKRDLLDFAKIDDSSQEYTHVKVLDCGNPTGNGWLFFRNKPKLYPGAQLALGTGSILKLLSPERIQEDIDYWHVESDGREGYVSAGYIFTKPI